MAHLICSNLFITMTVLCSLTAAAQDSKSNSHPNGGFGIPEVWGEATNGLQPDILVEKSKTDWHIAIEFFAQTNFSERAWLKISNRAGSKLQLWLTNGVELQSTNPNVLSAMNLPSQTTVSEARRGVRPVDARGLQWWRTRINGTVAGEFSPSASFNLQSAFDVSFANDVVLQITPLLYKVETNEVTAHLVEFPPIKVRLMSNGEVRKEE